MGRGSDFRLSDAGIYDGAAVSRVAARMDGSGVIVQYASSQIIVVPVGLINVTGPAIQPATDVPIMLPPRK